MAEVQKISEAMPSVSTTLASGLSQAIQGVTAPRQGRASQARELLQTVGFFTQSAQEKAEREAFEEGRRQTQEAIARLDLQTSKGIANFTEQVRKGEAPLGMHPAVYDEVVKYGYKQMAYAGARHLRQWYATSPLKGASVDLVAQEARKEMLKWASSMGVDPEDPRYVMNFNPTMEKKFTGFLAEAQQIHIGMSQKGLFDNIGAEAVDATNDAAISLLQSPTGFASEASLIIAGQRITAQVEQAVSMGASSQQANRQAWDATSATIRNNMANMLVIDPLAVQEDGTTAEQLIDKTYASSIAIIQGLPDKVPTAVLPDGTKQTWKDAPWLQQESAKLINQVDQQRDEAQARIKRARQQQRDTGFVNAHVSLNATMQQALLQGQNPETALTAKVLEIQKAYPWIAPKDLESTKKLILGTEDAQKQLLRVAPNDLEFKRQLYRMDASPPSEMHEWISTRLTGEQREQAMAWLRRQGDRVSKRAKAYDRDIYRDYVGLEGSAPRFSFQGDDREATARLVMRIVEGATRGLQEYVYEGEDMFMDPEGNVSYSQSVEQIDKVAREARRYIDEQLEAAGVLRQRQLPSRAPITRETALPTAADVAEARVAEAAGLEQRTEPPPTSPEFLEALREAEQLE